MNWAFPCLWSSLRITRRLVVAGMYVTLAVGAHARAANEAAPCTSLASRGEAVDGDQKTQSSPDKDTTETPLSAISSSQTVMPDLFTGTAAASIPLDLPYGRHGLQPHLALTYRSINTDGPVGVGWQLEVGHIVRNSKFGVSYEPCAGFQFVSSSGVSDLALVAIEGGRARYARTIEEDHTRFYRLGNDGVESQWVAVDRYGTRYEYGTTAEGRTQSEDGSKVYRWDLQRITDIHGNAIAFQYEKDGGTPYLSTVTYVEDNFGLRPPLHTISLFYELRPDRSVSYTPGFPIATARRLSQLIVQSGSKVFAFFTLTYKTSIATGRSLLQEVQRQGSDGRLERLAKLDYYEDPYSLDPAQLFFSGDLSSRWPMYRDLDFEGSGKTAASIATSCDTPAGTDQTGPIYIVRPRPTGQAQLELWARTNLHDCASEWYVVGDFNGDGRADWLVENPYFTGDLYVLLGRPCEPGIGCLAKYDGHPWITNTGFVVLPGNMFAADVEGNGITDILRLGSNGHVPGRDGLIDILQSTGSSFKPATVWSNDFQDPSPLRYRFGDFNGDGKTDIVHIGSKGELTVALSKGLTAARSGEWGPLGTGASDRTYCFADFNGDGLTDVASLGANGDVTVALSTGTSFTSPSVWWASGIASSKGPQLACDDLNGDGRADVAIFTVNGTHVSTAISRGDVFTPNLTDHDTGFPNVASKLDLGSHFVHHAGLSSMDLRAIYTGGQWVALSRHVATDLLAKFTNRFGGSASIRYSPSSSFHNTQLPVSYEVVTEIALSSGAGDDEAKYQFVYDGGYFHIRERQFRGFRSVRVNGPVHDNIYARSYIAVFHQGTGFLPDEDDPSASPGISIGRLASETISAIGTPLLRQTRYTYRLVPKDTVPSWYSPLTLAESRECDQRGCLSSRVEFSYDEFGNILQEVWFGGGPDFGVVRRVERTFAPNQERNLLSIIKSERVLDGGLGTKALTIMCTNVLGDVVELRRYKVENPKTDCTSTSPNEYVSRGAVYDSSGNLVRVVDENHKTMTIDYDKASVFPVSIRNQLGQVTRFEYSGVNAAGVDAVPYGLPTRFIDANGNHTDARYDSVGRLTDILLPDGAHRITYSYSQQPNQAGYEIQKLFDGHPIANVSLDGFGRVRASSILAREGEWLGQKAEYTASGQIARISSPTFGDSQETKWTILDYDAFDRLTNARTDSSSSYQQCYRPGVVSSVSRSGVRRAYEYDALGRLGAIHQWGTRADVCIADTNLSIAKALLSHDALNRIQSILDPDERGRFFSYDLLGRVRAVSIDDTLRINFSYDDAGNIRTRDDNKGHIVVSTFDALGRETKRVASSSTSDGTKDVITKWTYDTAPNGIGRVASITTPVEALRYSYDVYGRVAKISSVINKSTRSLYFTYTPTGALETIKYPNGSVVTYEYDGFVNRSVLLDGKEIVTNTAVDALGHSQRRVYASGLVENREFSGPYHKLSKISVETASGQRLLDKRFTYSGDEMTGINTTTSGSDSTLRYDGFGQLTEVDVGSRSDSFLYDQSGAMTQHGSLGAIEYYDPRYTNAVTRVGDRMFTYDEVGNRRSSIQEGKSASFSFDAENRLVAEHVVFAKCDGRSATLDMQSEYGADAQLVRLMLRQHGKTCGEHGKGEFALSRRYIGGLFVEEGSTSELWIPLQGSIGIIARHDSPCFNPKGCWALKVLFRDPAENVIASSNSHGTLDTISTDPFGGDIQAPEELVDSHVFRAFGGNEYLADLDLQNFRFRWYDPSIGQFISPDPVIRSESGASSFWSYSYGKNDPFGRPDRLGLFSDDPDDPDQPGDGGTSIISWSGSDVGGGMWSAGDSWGSMAAGGRANFYASTYIPSTAVQSGPSFQPASHYDESRPELTANPYRQFDDPDAAYKAINAIWAAMPPGAKMATKGVAMIGAALTGFGVVADTEVLTTSVMLQGALASQGLAGGIVTTATGVASLGLPPAKQEEIVRVTSTVVPYATTPLGFAFGSAGLMTCGPMCLDYGVRAGEFATSGLDFGKSAGEGDFLMMFPHLFETIKAGQELQTPKESPLQH